MIDVLMGRKYTGDNYLIVPQDELERDDEDFNGEYDAVWHIANKRVGKSLCGYEIENVEWYACTRLAPVKVCSECLKIEVANCD